ncbi:MAG TPA: response regulator transcription factor [Verrucomicrobiae bacterium]|jgi:two-component system invasion response regulator UvrY|nr:response regulator transcription factor [Verrucomicrobiae bacterium]
MMPPEHAGPAASKSPGKAPERIIHFLIVDDHAIIRQGLKQILGDAFKKSVFGEAANGNEALKRLPDQPWDVVLLDISMPGGNGLDVLQRLVEARPGMAVLVLSMHPEDQFAVRVLKAGAAGYVTKNTASEEVVGAVKRVLAGGKYISSSLAESLASGLTPASGKSPHETLSQREAQVLRLIATGRSAKEIASDLALSVKTISTYRSRILGKMKFKTNADIIRYAMQEKLVD